MAPPPRKLLLCPHDVRGGTCIRCGLATEHIEMLRHHHQLEATAEASLTEMIRHHSETEAHVRRAASLQVIATITAGLINSMDAGSRAILTGPASEHQVPIWTDLVQTATALVTHLGNANNKES